MNKMNTIPVRRYKRLAYPTKLEILARPELLQKRVPQAWQGRPEMAGAVALFMAVNTAGLNNQANAGEASKAGALVAPIFEHGKGGGATGCMVMSPPVFLSEEEALQVISEELAKHDVELTVTNRAIPGAKIPRRYQVMETQLWGVRAPDWLLKWNKQNQMIPSSAFKRVQRNVVDRENGVPLMADGSDPERNVAVEYVSEKDERDLGWSRGSKKGFPVLSSVRSHNLKGISESVVEEVEKRGKQQVHFGTFYDPCVPLDFGKTTAQAEAMQKASKEDQRIARRKHYKAIRDAAKAESRRLLRQQVLDFVNWLKGQGVI